MADAGGGEPEVLLRFALDGERGNWSLTLRDFTVRPLEAPVTTP
jgi:hypothetical protein